jgi:hypothetical protein
MDVMTSETVVRAVKELARVSYRKLGPVSVRYDPLVSTAILAADGRSTSVVVPRGDPQSIVKALDHGLRRLWGGRPRSATALLCFDDRKMLPQERWEEDGKPQWRHMLRLELTEDDAWKTVHELLGQLEREEEPAVVLVGELRRMRDK